MRGRPHGCQSLTHRSREHDGPLQTAPSNSSATIREIKSVGLCCDTRLFIGQYTQPQITVTYTDNSTENWTGYSNGWVSANPSIAGIASQGQIRGNAQGYSGGKSRAGSQSRTCYR